MINLIKDRNGIQIKEPEQTYVIELNDGQMYEVVDLKEAVAVICSKSYLDSESAETRLQVRLTYAKNIGLYLVGSQDRENVIVYDERIGKIPFSYTDPNPDYEIPRDPELIRVETDETFIYTLAKIKYIRLWEKTDKDYEDVLKIKNVDNIIENIIRPFREKSTEIPLHKRLNRIEN